MQNYTLDRADYTVDCYCLQKDFATGAVVICPGGGYSFLSDREAAPVANAFNQAGYHAFVLRYTVSPPPLGSRPLGQLAETVRYVRSKEAKLGIGPNCIAVCGFSAGGHLAASLGTLWDREDLFPGVRDRRVHRPDALILSYPVITAGEYAHSGSFEQLTGSDDAADRAPWSLERQVTEETPPTFLWHTVADPTVPVQNSLLLAQALLDRGVPLELHLFPHGEHGLSLATPDVAQPEKNRMPDPHVARWFDLATGWLVRTLETE